MKYGRWVLLTITMGCFSLEGLPTVVPDPIPCVRDLELHFFNETYLKQGLSLFNIREELWSSIYLTLQEKSADVPERMKRRTAYMVPNPLEYPMQKEKVAVLLRDVLFEVFLEVMQFYYVNARPNADFVFDYILTQQLPNFVRCFGPEAKKLEPKFD